MPAAAIIAVAVTVAGSVVASSLHRATGPIIVALAAAGFSVLVLSRNGIENA
jgi:ABC-type Mn2+/Zn2+ transport system permease subunit